MSVDVTEFLGCLSDISDYPMLSIMLDEYQLTDVRNWTNQILVTTVNSTLKN